MTMDPDFSNMADQQRIEGHFQKAELYNGRLAMLGFMALVGVEQLTGAPFSAILAAVCNSMF